MGIEALVKAFAEIVNDYATVCRNLGQMEGKLWALENLAAESEYISDVQILAMLGMLDTARELKDGRKNRASEIIAD